MNGAQRLPYVMALAAADKRLRPVHVALIVALCHLWMKNSFNKWYPISRKRLMRLSRIHSNATYHKVISELQYYGYLQYHPSYHPRQGTRVSIVIQSNLTP
jgi:hypothetical protein